jgi:endo-1,3(4)-beta-glucanase
MVATALLLLAIVQVSGVYGLPAGEIKQNAFNLDERAISISLKAEPTTSYSTAITSLQSLSISVLPSITGVRMILCRNSVGDVTHADSILF